MNSFNYFAPTDIRFGWGRLSELGELAARYGNQALLVTEAGGGTLSGVYERALVLLERAGVHTSHFDGVKPNPTTVIVSAGARAARDCGAKMVIGVGGGSAMDTAKAIAVEATHPGTAWDYLHYTDGPTEKTLPIIAVSTTAGTGSQTTPCAVVTNPETRDKSAIWHRNIFPRVALVDPELTASMPASVTAQTGFDAFCHNFEAYLSVNTNPLVECMALDAIGIIAKYLPVACKDGANREAREAMAWADTLGGLTNASAGVTLPHGLGMQIGGLCPWISHGQALATLYPSFTRYTMSVVPEKFARVGRILNPALATCDQQAAVEGACVAIDELLKRIGLWINLRQLGMPEADVRETANRGQVLGDYKNNPRVATIDEMYAIMRESYTRE